jgi:hypothetical protein
MCTWESPAPELFAEDFLYSDRDRKCSECGIKIHRNEEYKHIIGLWEGDMSQIVQCYLCARIMEDLVDMGFCPNYGELWEYIDEEFEQPDEED